MCGGVFVIALFLPVIKKNDWNRFVLSILVVACLIATPFIFTSSYIVLLYVDSILGIIFSYVMFYAFTEESESLFSYLNIGLGCFVLCLTKESGVFLAVVAIVAMLLVSFFVVQTRRSWTTKCLIGVSGILGMLVGKCSWSLFLVLTKTKEAWNMSSLSLGNFINLLLGKGADYQYETIKAFLRASYRMDFGGNMFQMKYISWIGLAIFFFLILKLVVKEINQLKWNIYIYTSLAGLLLYTLGLLLLYLFTYSEVEARGLASYQRYLATYLIGIFCFCLSLFFYYTLQNIKDKNFANVIVVGAGYILLLFIPPVELYNITVGRGASIESTNTLRAQYMNLDQYISCFDYHTDKIYLVCQNTQGYQYLYLRYLLSPVQVGGPFYSVGEPSDNYTLDQWIGEIINQNITYVYLHLIDEKFIEGYGSVFEGDIEQGSLYKVSVNGNQILLKKCY